MWAEPSLLTHLGVLALVGLQAGPRVLVELWLLTLGPGRSWSSGCRGSTPPPTWPR